MRNKGPSGNKRLATTLLAALLGALLLAPVASAQTVGTTSFPGTGGAIAFSSSRNGFPNINIYRMNADGFGQTRLTDQPDPNFNPNWSADGKKIAFSNAPDLGVQSDVWSMNADGSNETHLVQDPSDDGGPAYAPAGSKFAFVGRRNGNQSDIYLMAKGPDGQTAGLTRLTTSDANDFSPAISPDGKWLAFVSNRDGDEDIYVMKLAPEGRRNVPVKLTKNTRPDPNGAPYMYDQSPDWSPDGKQIAFASDRGGNPEVYRMKAAPEGAKNRPVNLSRNPGRDLVPTWFPDGKKVAFQSNRPASDGTTDYEIWRARTTDGANQTNLTNNSTNEYQPDWQPLP
jgi:TolB protein